MWAGLEKLAHTFVYDALCLLSGRPEPARLAAIRQPTLVATGGSAAFFDASADVVAKSIPRAERVTLDGQSHMVDATVLAPVLARFFGA